MATQLGAAHHARLFHELRVHVEPAGLTPGCARIVIPASPVELRFVRIGAFNDLDDTGDAGLFVLRGDPTSVIVCPEAPSKTFAGGWRTLRLSPVEQRIRA